MLKQAITKVLVNALCPAKEFSFQIATERDYDHKPRLKAVKTELQAVGVCDAEKQRDPYRDSRQRRILRPRRDYDRRHERTTTRR